jgi:hypothetical protein
MSIAQRSQASMHMLGIRHTLEAVATASSPSSFQFAFPIQQLLYQRYRKLSHSTSVRQVGLAIELQLACTRPLNHLCYRSSGPWLLGGL